MLLYFSFACEGGCVNVRAQGLRSWERVGSEPRGRCGSAGGAPAGLPRGRSCRAGAGGLGGCWSSLTCRANETRCLDVEKDELYCEECEKPVEPGSLPSRAGGRTGQGKRCTSIAKHTIITESVF